MAAVHVAAHTVAKGVQQRVARPAAPANSSPGCSKEGQPFSPKGDRAACPSSSLSGWSSKLLRLSGRAGCGLQPPFRHPWLPGGHCGERAARCRWGCCQTGMPTRRLGLCRKARRAHRWALRGRQAVQDAEQGRQADDEMAASRSLRLMQLLGTLAHPLPCPVVLP